jgi:hypothetical protein
MTLVARVSPFGCPLMLADILITTPQPDRQTQADALPSIGHLALIADSAIDLGRVAGLAQKVCVIAADLAVGWSGDYKSAERIISAMRAYPWPDRITTYDVQECLATTSYEDQAAVSLVGIFSHDKWFGEFGMNAPKVSLPLFNECRVIGGGSGAFIRMCRDIGDLCLPTPEESDSSWVKATTAVLMASSTLIGEEVNNFGGLPEGFGGLFEVLMFQDDKFTKLDDILYCFWAVLEHSKEEAVLAAYTAFIKVKYYGDILVVRRSDFANEQQMHNMQFIVGPMAKTIAAEEVRNIGKLDLDSIHNCHYVMVRSGEDYEILVIASLFARNSMVRFHQLSDGRVSFAVEGDLLKYIHSRVVERFYGECR